MTWTNTDGKWRRNEKGNREEDKWQKLREVKCEENVGTELYKSEWTNMTVFVHVVFFYSIISYWICQFSSDRPRSNFRITALHATFFFDFLFLLD